MIYMHVRLKNKMDLGVPATQSACYGLRYRFGTSHHACKHACPPHA